eukprot:scaffold250781_cov32-Tisochrysis_lutea.AAC.1
MSFCFSSETSSAATRWHLYPRAAQTSARLIPACERGARRPPPPAHAAACRRSHQCCQRWPRRPSPLARAPRHAQLQRRWLRPRGL